MQIPAQVESWAQNQIQPMLSRPINIEAFKVRGDWGLYALVARINHWNADGVVLDWSTTNFSNIKLNEAVISSQRSGTTHRSEERFELLLQTWHIDLTHDCQRWYTHLDHIDSCQRSTYETNGLLHLIIHSNHLDPACWAMWLQVEQSPREPWVINDRARVARVCLWLTQFDPHCLVTIVIGQPRSLWVTGRIPGATRWSAEWAWVNRGLGVENRRRCRLGFQMGIITRYSKEESLSHLLLYDLGGVTPTSPTLSHSPLFTGLKSLPIFGSRGHYWSIVPQWGTLLLLSISSIFYKNQMPNPNMVPVQSITIARLHWRKF